jgi:hypothetical protein
MVMLCRSQFGAELFERAAFHLAITFILAVEPTPGSEVVDNITIHSETPVPGVVCAQHFPERKRIDVGIYDLGCGIKASLSERYQLADHEDPPRNPQSRLNCFTACVACYDALIILALSSASNAVMNFVATLAELIPGEHKF